MIIILRFWGFVALLPGDLHLFERLFVIGWENNKDCDITMPLSLKTMEVNEVNNVTGKGSFNIRNWDVLNVLSTNPEILPTFDTLNEIK